MRNSHNRLLALLLSLAMIVSVGIIPAVAENSESRIVTLGFDNVAWHTEDSETYCSADITASLNTEDESFDAMLIQFNIVYGTVAGVLGLDAVIASDSVEKVTYGSGRNQKTSTMTIDAINATTADSLGYATVLMHGDNGIRHPIKNGQVIATAYFLLADDSKKSVESRLSFDTGVINYIDDGNEIQNYSVITNASITVPALVPPINAQELKEVTLNPTEVTATNAEQTVQASAVDKDNKPVTTGLVWSLDRTDGASIDGNGVITVTSTANGNYIVTANPAENVTNVTGTAQAVLKVNPILIPQELKEVTLNPTEVTATNAEQTVQASAVDKDSKPVTSGLVWSLDRTDGASIDGNGVITVTSTASGNYVVTANPGENVTNVTGTAQAVLKVNPILIPQELKEVTLNPTEVTATNAEQTVQASAVDKDNKPVTSGLVWSLDRTDGVSIDGNGVITVTSTASGNYVVTANPGENVTNVTGTAQTVLKVNPILIPQELKEVTLNPTEVTATSAEQTVQASAVDKDNKPVTSGLVWSLDRTDGASIDGNGVITVTSTANGNYVVTANPSENVTNVTGTAQAILKVNPIEHEYSVEVSSGSIQNPSESGKYKAGESISITANPPPDGKVFDKWLGAEGLTFTNGNQNSASATFTMPGNDINLTATFRTQTNEQGCYVATAVYGSYDCPEVWTLRRFRDNVLAKTWYGRLFIRLYYAVSPTAVKLFGDSEWFQNFFRDRLDKMVSGLQADGFESTPYQDRAW